MNEFIWYLLVSVPALNAVISSSTHIAAAKNKIAFLWPSSISLSIGQHFVYPFITWWALRLFPLLGYCGESEMEWDTEALLLSF